MLAIYDSGIGGLSIYKAIHKALPGYDILYLADSKFFPYGKRSTAQIKTRADSIVAYLEKQGADIIIIACNTITVTAIDSLRKKHANTPIVGVVPVVKTCAERTRTGNIGILATLKTAHSTYQKNLISKFAGNRRVYNYVCSDLVKAVEYDENIASVASVMRAAKSIARNNVDVVALGCTHFPLVKKDIQKIFGKSVTILDSSDAVARQTARIVKNENIGAGIGHTIFVSTKNTLDLQGALRKHLNIRTAVKNARI